MSAALVWIKQLAAMNSTASETMPFVKSDSSGNVYVAYITAGTVSGGTIMGINDVVISKLDTSGNLVWVKQQSLMNTTSNESGIRMEVDSSGNIYAAYLTQGTVSGGTYLGGTDLVVSKMDTNGNMIWIKQERIMNTTVSESTPSIAVDSDGNVHVSYSSAGTVSGGTNLGPGDVVVLKLDQNGNAIWIKQLRATNTIDNDANINIALDSSGNIYAAYQTQGTVSGGTFRGTIDIAVFKMDASGNLVWLRQSAVMNTTASDSIPRIGVDSSGNVYVSYVINTGTVSGGTLSAGNDIVLFKMDTNGNMVWIRQQLVMNTLGNDNNQSLVVDSSGNSYVTYHTDGTVSGGTNFGNFDIVVFKMNTSGNMVWIKQEPLLNTTTTGQFATIALDSSQNIYMAYQSNSAVSGGTLLGANDIVVMKFQQDLQIPPTISSSLISSYNNSWVNLYWLTTNGADSINVYRDVQSSGATKSLLGNTKGLRYMDTSLSVSGTYYYFLTGIYNGVETTVSAPFTFVFAPSISLSWIKQLARMNSISNEQSPSVSTDSSGNMYVAYQTFGTISGGTNRGSSWDIVVVKVDTNGNVVWTRQQSVMNSTASDTVPYIAVDSSGNIYVSYQCADVISGGTFAGGTDIVVFKMDTNGNMIWIKQQRVMNTTVGDVQPRITLDSSGNSYVCYRTTGTVSGGTFSGGGSGDIVVFKLDTNGNMAWIKQQQNIMNTTGSEWLPDIVVDTSGNVYVTYYTDGTLSGGIRAGLFDVVVFKMDTNGSMIWVRQRTVMNTTADDIEPRITVDSSGNAYVCYRTTGTTSGGTLTVGGDVVVFKMDANGNLVWIRQRAVMNTLGNDINSVIIADSSGNVYVAYNVDAVVSGGTASGGNDIIFFKMDTNGNLEWIKQEGILNTTSEDTFPSIALDSSNNLFITYQTTGTVSGGTLLGGSDIVMAKYTQPITTTTPSAPSALSATAGNQQLAIAFTPGSDGGLDITNYQYSIDNGATFTPFSPATGAVSSVTITGLTNGTSYSVQLKAVNANGASPASATVTATPSTTPSAPTALSATSGDQQLTISFTPGNNGGAAITNYQYSIDNGATFTAFSPATGAVSSVTITGLTNGTSYSVQLKAVNAVGTSPASSTVTATPFAPPAVPTALYTVTGDQQLLVYFTPGSDNGSAITNYQYSTNNGSSFTAFSPATGAVSMVTITGLTNGMAYSIQLKAVNAGGVSAASATATGTPASVTSAVAGGPSGINDYIGAQTLTNDTQKAATTIDVRTAIKAATYPDDATKAASQIAYINSMRTQIGATSYTMPATDFSPFLASFASSASGVSAQPVQVFYPVYTSQTATVDVSAASPTNYVHVEVPVGYSVTLQNGAASLKLTNNGTSYVDDSATVYTVNTAILLGSKTFTILGIGSIVVDGEDSNAVECLTAGTELLTPSGNIAIDSLRQGDHVITGNKEVVPIERIHKIVVVNATDKNAPYVIEKEAFGVNCPPNRLEVSPRHAIQLRPGVWEVPREAAKENKRVYQNKDAIGSKVIYYHVTLPNYERDTIVANGQITEALNDGKVMESYAWSAAQRGYVRHTKPADKDSTSVTKH
jgi:hypothetical protein